MDNEKIVTQEVEKPLTEDIDLDTAKSQAKEDIDKILSILKEDGCEGYVPEDGYSLTDDGQLKVQVVVSYIHQAEESDFDWGEPDQIKFNAADALADDFAEEHCPEAVAEAEGWPLEGDFYQLPFNGWKLLDEVAVEAMGEPSVINYEEEPASYWYPGDVDYDISDSEVEVVSYFYFYKPLNVTESVNEDLTPKQYADKAWMLNKILLYMNDEEAYYSGWLYIWPDGSSYDDCLEDFGNAADYQELEDLFIRIYSDPEFHESGLYHLRDSDITPEEWKEIVDAAHEWDKKLGLQPIDDLNAEE